MICAVLVFARSNHDLSFASSVMASGALVGMFERGIQLVDSSRNRVRPQTLPRSMVTASMSKRHRFRSVGRFERQSELVEQNKRLLRENERLLRENATMLEDYSSGRSRESTNQMCANALQVTKNLKIMCENMKSLK